VLGALAIISAILIVLADRERRSTAPVEQTVTDTVAPAPGAPARPSGWTDTVLPGGSGTEVATVPAGLMNPGPAPLNPLAQDDGEARR
jgi:serine/threonine-protein kinase